MAKDNKALYWLYKELPELIRSGVLSEEVAARLKNHYGPAKVFDRKNLVLSIVSVVGTLCVGLGIILLFAHNWDIFSRIQKVAISAIPLLASFFILVKIGFKQDASTSAKESASVFNVLSLGAAIALISQAYQLPSDLERFTLVWMILSIPTVYFMRSSLACLLYLAGLTYWAGEAQNCGGQALLFWPLAAAVAPFLSERIRKMRQAFSIGTSWLMVAVCVCLTVALGVTLEKNIPGLWILIYSSFFSLLFVIGSHTLKESAHNFPFRRYGLVALVVLSYVLTFSGVWEDIGWNHYRDFGRYHAWAGYADYLILTVFLSSGFILLLRYTRAQGFRETLYGYLPLLTALFFLFDQMGLPDLYSCFFFNFYLLVMGYCAIGKGIKEMRLIWLNAGLVIVGVVIATRFLSEEFGILGRSLVFIFLGICLLAANHFMKKKMERVGHA